MTDRWRLAGKMVARLIKGPDHPGRAAEAPTSNPSEVPLTGPWRIAKGPSTAQPGLRIAEDGSITINHHGVAAELSADGSISMGVGTITRIGVENIVDLKSYGLSHSGGRTMHIIEFRDGGSCEVTYTADGHLEIFRGNGVGLERLPDGSVVLKRAEPSPPSHPARN